MSIDSARSLIGVLTITHRAAAPSGISQDGRFATLCYALLRLGFVSHCLDKDYQRRYTVILVSAIIVISLGRWRERDKDV